MAICLVEVEIYKYEARFNFPGVFALQRSQLMKFHPMTHVTRIFTRKSLDSASTFLNFPEKAGIVRIPKSAICGLSDLNSFGEIVVPRTGRFGAAC